MKKLDIAITKAQLKSFSVDTDDGKPVVSITLALMTEGGKQITTYTIDTHDWRKDPLDLPIAALPLIGDLARMLEGAAVRHCRDSQLALPAPTPKAGEKMTLKGFPNVPDGTEVTVIDKGDALEITTPDDTPINLDDIPF